MPKRIQMSRQHPWRTANPDAVIVARPSKWGNPFKVEKGGMSRADAVAHYRHMLQKPGVRGEVDRALIRAELAGKDLACWCRIDELCHADVLLEIANAEVS